MTEDASALDLVGALTTVAGAMIPPNTDYAVPGAGDPAIIADIVASLQTMRVELVESLGLLDTLARDRFGADLAGLAPDDIGSLLDALASERPDFHDLIVRHTLQCYYRDDRIMRALGMEVRPPYPEGFVVEDGDWSLLDPVRRRDRMYREAP